MSKKIFSLLNIFTKSTGSFELSTDLFIKWFKSKMEPRISKFLIFFMRNLSIKKKFSIKRKILSFFSFFLISQFNLNCRGTKNFLNFSLFFLLRNLEPLKKNLFLLGIEFFSLFFSNLPNGASVNFSILFIFFASWMNETLYKKKGGGKVPLYFLFRFNKEGSDNDIIINFFLKNPERILEGHEKKIFLRNVYVNRFLTGTFIRNFKVSQFRVALIRNLNFKNISIRQISKIKILTQKKIRTKIINGWYFKPTSSKKKILKRRIEMIGKISNKSGGVFLFSILTKTVFSSCQNINRKDPLNFLPRKNKNFPRKWILLFRNETKPSGINYFLEKTIKKGTFFSSTKIEVEELETISHWLFFNQKEELKIKRVFRFCKSLFLEVLTDFFFRKKKKEGFLSRGLFKNSEILTQKMVNFKILNTIFFWEEKTFQKFFKKFFGREIWILLIIQEIVVTTKTLNEIQSLIKRIKLETPEILNYLFRNQNFIFNPNKNWCGWFLNFFYSKKEATNKPTGLERKFWDQNRRGGAIFHHFLWLLFYSWKLKFGFSEKKSKPKKPLQEEFSKEAEFPISFFCWGLSNHSLFHLQLLKAFFFQVFGQESDMIDPSYFLGRVKIKNNLFKKGIYGKRFFRRLLGLIINSRLGFWLGKIKGYWCDFFWDKSFFLFTSLLEKVLNSLFLSWKKKEEKNFLSSLRIWLTKSKSAQKKANFFKKKEKVFRSVSIPSLISYLNNIS